MLFQLNISKESPASIQLFQKQVADTISPYKSGPTLKGELRFDIPAGMSSDTAKSIIEDSIKSVPAMKNFTIKVGGNQKSGSNQIILSPPSAREKKSENTSENQTSSLVSLSAVPKTSIPGNISADWPSILLAHQTPAIINEYSTRATSSGESIDIQSQYSPARVGQTVDLLQINKGKVGEAKVEADNFGQPAYCILTLSYRSGVQWVPFQRQLSPASNAAWVDVGAAVKDGVNLTLAQLGEADAQSKKSGPPQLTEYQRLSLAYSLYTTFQTYHTVDFDNSTDKTDDFVSTKNSSWGQVMGGIEASNLSLEDKKSVKAKLKEYAENKSTSILSSPGSESVQGKTSYISSLTNQLTNTLTDYFFPPENMATLPSTPTGDYLRAEYKKNSQELHSSIEFLAKASSGVLPLTLYDPYGGGPNKMVSITHQDFTLSDCKSGLTAEGKPFVAVGEDAMQRIKAIQDEQLRTGGVTVRFPDYVVRDAPAGGVVMFEGKREGEWALTPSVTPQNASSTLNDFLRTDRQHYQIVDVWAKAPLSENLVTQAGRYSSVKEALADPMVNSAVVLRGYALLQDGIGSMSNVWAENVSFGSFNTHVWQNHTLLFGKKNDEYYVVDASLSVRGKGSTPAEALKDLATCGFVAGVYRRDADKKVGSPTWTSSMTEQMALPADKGWFHDALNYASNLELCYFAPWIWTQVAGAVGSVSRFLETKIDARDLEFHKGSAFDLNSSSADLSEVMLGLGLALSFGRLRVLANAERAIQEGIEAGAIAVNTAKAGSLTTKAMFGSELGAFGTSGVLAFVSERQKEEHLSNLAVNLSQEHISKLKSPGDDVIVEYMQVTILDLYKWARAQDGLPALSEIEAAGDLKTNWMPRILSALNTQMPLGPEGASEVILTKRFMLAPSVEWADKNREYVSDLAHKMNWPVSTAMLYMLMFGGPAAPAKTPEASLSKLKSISSDDFNTSTTYLISLAPKSWGADFDKLHSDITLGFMDGRIHSFEFGGWETETNLKNRKLGRNWGSGNVR